MSDQSSTDATPEKNLAAFARALGEHMALARVSTAEMARRVGRSHNMLKRYLLADAPPPPDVVFKMEEALGLAPNTLSRLLGFCRCDENVGPAGVPEALQSDPDLQPWEKDSLMTLYTNFKKSKAEQRARGSSEGPLLATR